LKAPNDATPTTFQLLEVRKQPGPLAGWRARRMRWHGFAVRSLSRAPFVSRVADIGAAADVERSHVAAASPAAHLLPPLRPVTAATSPKTATAFHYASPTTPPLGSHLHHAATIRHATRAISLTRKTRHMPNSGLNALNFFSLKHQVSEQQHRTADVTSNRRTAATRAAVAC